MSGLSVAQNSVVLGLQSIDPKILCRSCKELLGGCRGMTPSLAGTTGENELKEMSKTAIQFIIDHCANPEVVKVYSAYLAQYEE